MQLKVITPTAVVVETEVERVRAEAADGSFCLLPRHIDFVASLAPGLLSFTPPGGGEQLLAADEGVLVKCGDDVTVSVRRALRGDNLETLQRTVEEEFMKLDQRQKKARSALARLEADFVRRYIGIQET